MKWSAQQLDIFEAVKSGKNVLAKSGPGSGKSTTLKGIATNNSDKKILLIVFNNATAIELQEKMPENVIVSTIHSVGNAVLYNNNPEKIFNKWLHDKKYGKLDKKINQTFFYTLRDQGFDMSEANLFIDYLKNVCDKLRFHLADYTNDDEVIEVCEHYGLPVERLDLIKECMLQMNNAFKIKNWVDFTDMLSAPILFNLDKSGTLVKTINGEKVFTALSSFDLILLDEAQDFSLAAIRLMKELFGSKQFAAVGDNMQSINGFAGAAVNSLDILTEELNLVPMPLNITYRCPSSHVEFVNNKFKTDLECGNDRVGGIYENCNVDSIVDNLKVGDLVLSRNQNGKDAKLIPVMRRAIQANLPCRLLGFDLVKIAKSELNSTFKKVKALTFDSYYEVEQIIREKQIDLTEKKWSPDIITMFTENLEMIKDLLLFFIENKGDNNDWKAFLLWLSELENDKNAAIVFSTLHKSKGREANTVHILDYDKLPGYRKENQPWMNTQEDNLLYVGLTRSLNNMYLYNSE